MCTKLQKRMLALIGKTEDDTKPTNENENIEEALVELADMIAAQDDALVELADMMTEGE